MHATFGSMSWNRPLLLAAACSVLAVTGCGPTYTELRMEGQREMVRRQWGGARHLLQQAQRHRPGNHVLLHDLGVCSTMLAKEQIELRNEPAAQREIDRAIEYYSRSISAHPGFRPSIIGKNRAQELKGQFEEALRTAHWAARYVGPSAEQFLFLGAEYEERGDLDAAMLRYRQAAAVEPRNPQTHKALGMLLLRAGNKPAAIEALQQALRLDPAQADISRTLRDLGEPVPMVDLGPTD